MLEIKPSLFAQISAQSLCIDIGFSAPHDRVIQSQWLLRYVHAVNFYENGHVHYLQDWQLQADSPEIVPYLSPKLLTWLFLCSWHTTQGDGIREDSLCILLSIHFVCHAHENHKIVPHKKVWEVALLLGDSMQAELLHICTSSLHLVWSLCTGYMVAHNPKVAAKELYEQLRWSITDVTYLLGPKDLQTSDGIRAAASKVVHAVLYTPWNMNTLSLSIVKFSDLQMHV